jgi:hypothetical protein
VLLEPKDQLQVLKTTSHRNKVVPSLNRILNSWRKQFKFYARVQIHSEKVLISLRMT